MTDSLLGTVELSLNNPAAAVVFWQNALQHTPAGPGAGSPPAVPAKDMARALLRAGQPAEARHRLQSLLAESPDPEAFWLLSRTFLQERAMPEALAAWKRGGSFRDENPLVPEPARFVGSEGCAPCHPATISLGCTASDPRPVHRQWLNKNAGLLIKAHVIS
jgi:Tetratricopeptide repeat